MKRTDENRIAHWLCPTPWEARCCDDCARLRANHPEGTWSPVADQQPMLTRDRGCGSFIGMPVRAKA